MFVRAHAQIQLINVNVVTKHMRFNRRIPLSGGRKGKRSPLAVVGKVERLGHVLHKIAPWITCAVLAASGNSIRVMLMLEARKANMQFCIFKLRTDILTRKLAAR